MAWMKTLAFHLNVFAQCKRLGVPLWSCPQFLFMVMGIINIVAILAVYNIAQTYAAPELVIFVVVGLSTFLFIVSFIIISAFEQVVMARQQEVLRHRELLAMKDQFVFVAAHELRTPANAIRWALETLEARKSPMLEQEKEVVSALQISSTRLLDLVKDLLEVARIETGAVSMHLQPLSIGAVLKESLESLVTHAEKSKIQIQNNVPEDLPMVFADKARLKEVFDNLITNAIKYNKEDGSVILTAEPQTGGISLHIRDEGKGISVDDQPHIFEKFWRSVDTHAIEGSGLGLFIVKQLMTLMQGRITFSSEKDLGTVFSIYLPSPQSSVK